MKNSGACPKCQGTDLIRLRNNGIHLGMRVVPITRYVCYDCGFSEEWIESRADRHRLREKLGLARDNPVPEPPDISIEDQLGLS